jgi:hypothetical protein
MADLTLTTLDWVPETPRDYVRDIRVRWALEEALKHRHEITIANGSPVVPNIRSTETLTPRSPSMPTTRSWQSSLLARSSVKTFKK